MFPQPLDVQAVLGGRDLPLPHWIALILADIHQLLYEMDPRHLVFLQGLQGLVQLFELEGFPLQLGGQSPDRGLQLVGIFQ
jgi:hypothetical protein